MNRTEMKHCIDQVIALGNEVRAANELDQRAAAKPAASPDILARFATAFAERIPPSFSELLSIYNGVICFDYVDVDLFSIEYLTRHSVELEEEWVDAGKFQSNEIFVFGRSDSDSLAVAFLLRQRRDDGEMPVVMVDARGVLVEYSSLEDYLRSRREWFEEQMQLVKGDRAGVRDDE
jgi:hypothetical protein